MNYDQIMGIVRIVFAAGGPLAAFWVKLGLTADQANAFDNALIGLLSVAPPVVMGVWSYIAHNRQNKIKAVAAMPEVKQVVVAPVDQAMKGLIADRDVPKVTG